VLDYRRHISKTSDLAQVLALPFHSAAAKDFALIAYAGLDRTATEQRWLDTIGHIAPGLRRLSSIRGHASFALVSTSSKTLRPGVGLARISVLHGPVMANPDCRPVLGLDKE
jgi:hypothetical protein